ncbi:conserved hypothetical protein [Perkinsus marinus ATCC 50983]|uniref:Tyr recombinase domain-containing protein n=1 Tax=Perkinsus marinus (strain ATCC 50983 / TXsc) TaxID=423536 RepID=C5KYJ1_PERM5|nr:conserved hypothetical protein [Perkinsus marinus ATCC 50983]EER10426.1 conserved hypothetical protein [Perkinsus marinus ATCC 50983]|eukprot:XP_002778631.1 conserved hypothetical protein [Perkinsus marinus ATCC 50983]
MSARRKKAVDFLAEARARGQNVPEEVGDLIRSALAPSTRRTYSSGEKLFRDVILGSRVRLDKMYPVSAESVLTFVYILNKVGYAYSTIKTYTAALKTRNIEVGHIFSQIEVEHIRRALIAVRKENSGASVEPTAKLPVTISQTRQALKACVKEKKRSGIALLVCIFGLLRCRECLGLRCNDITFNTIDDMDVVSLYINRSKCDRFGEGALVRIGCAVRSTARPCKEPLCAVHQLYAFMCDGFAANTMERTSLLFNNLSYSTFRRHVQEVFRSSERPQSSVATHSLRRSGAQWMWFAGISTFNIAQYGRWSVQSVLERTYLKGVTKASEHQYASSMMRGSYHP